MAAAMAGDAHRQVHLHTCGRRGMMRLLRENVERVLWNLEIPKTDSVRRGPVVAVCRPWRLETSFCPYSLRAAATNSVKEGEREIRRERIAEGRPFLRDRFDGDRQIQVHFCRAVESRRDSPEIELLHHARRFSVDIVKFVKGYEKVRRDIFREITLIYKNK